MIEHLSTTWLLTADAMEDRLRKERPVQTRRTPKQRVAQFMVCDLGYFPRGREAPSITKPAAETASPLDGNDLVTRIGTILAAMDSALDRMEPVAAGKVALTHPVLGPLTVAQWRKFHRVHARHHAGQIRAAIVDR